MIIIGVAIVMLFIVIGIVGIKKSGDMYESNYFITAGGVICLITIMPVLIGLKKFSIVSLVWYFAPAIYIYKGWQRRKGENVGDKSTDDNNTGNYKMIFDINFVLIKI